jgi:hypothetical protein
MPEVESSTRITQLIPAQGVYAEYTVAGGLPGETVFEKVYAWALTEADYSGVVGLVHWFNEDGDPYLTPVTETGGFLGYKAYKDTPEYKVAHSTPKGTDEFFALLPPSHEISQQHIRDAWPALQRCNEEALLTLACGAVVVVARKSDRTPKEVLTNWLDNLEQQNQDES